MRTWEEFKERLAEFRLKCASSPEAANAPLLFRGQGNSSWFLETTLDRERAGMSFDEYYRLISRVQPEIESLTGREWKIPDYAEVTEGLQEYDSFSVSLSWGGWPAYAYMVYLRHHGFPSALLDWSRSPYLAAFFAFIRVTDHSSGHVSIYALSRCRFPVSGNCEVINVFYPGPFVTTHRRHFLQQSQYTLCLSFEEEWRFARYDSVFKPGHSRQGICCKFVIPAAERNKVLAELDEYNLNAFSLFGSEESMMETLATREFRLLANTEKKVQATSSSP